MARVDNFKRLDEGESPLQVDYADSNLALEEPPLETLLDLKGPLRLMPVIGPGLPAKVLWYLLYLAVFVNFCVLLTSPPTPTPTYLYFGKKEKARIFSQLIWPTLPVAMLVADVFARRILTSDELRTLADHGIRSSAALEKTRKEWGRSQGIVFGIWLTSLIVSGVLCAISDYAGAGAFLHMVVPMSILCLPGLVIAVNVLGLVAMVSLRDVETFIARIDPSTPSVENGRAEFWVDLIGLFEGLDVRLENIWMLTFTPLAIGAMVTGFLALLCAIQGVHAFEKHDWLEAFIRFSVAFGYCIVLLLGMLPFAKVTEKCNSMQARSGSLRLTAANCGGHKMSQDTRFCYNSFMSHVDRSVIGAEVPAIGLVSMDFLVRRLFTIATVFPVVVSFFLNKMFD